MAGAASHAAPHAVTLEGPRHSLSTFPLLTPEELRPRGRAAASQRWAAGEEQACAGCTWLGVPSMRVEGVAVGRTADGSRRRVEEAARGAGWGIGP